MQTRGTKRKPDVEPEREVKKAKTGAVLCEKAVDCWNEAVKDLTCQAHLDAEAKALLCDREGCPKEKSCWGGGFSGGWCREHFEQERTKHEVMQTTIFRCTCNAVVEVKDTLCPPCKLRSEHTPDGWTLGKHQMWKCKQHGCRSSKMCNGMHCCETALRLIEGKFFCDWHHDKFIHDKTCKGNKENHKGCRGPVPLQCAMCKDHAKVKFLNNTKQWLCKDCTPIRSALFKENGKVRKCSSCDEDSVAVAQDLRPLCQSHCS